MPMQPVRSLRSLRGTDTSFLIALGILVAFGLIFLSSASAPLSFERFHSRSYYLNHQLLSGLLPGAVLFVAASRIRLRVLQRLAIPVFVLSLVLLAAVFIPGLGTTHGRTQSWLTFGLITFQPAELVKLGLILALAAWFSVRRPTWFDIKSWKYGLLPILGCLGLISGLLALQPDIGTLVVVAAIGIIVAFVAGMPWLHLATVGGLGSVAFFALIKAAPYRLARLTVFLHPEFDPQGVGYQTNQALLAVGSGGWFGLGLGRSRQKFSFLPEVISDSIFAIITEEIGFIFTLAFLALIGYVIWRVLRNALEARDEFSRLVLTGIAAWWGVQTIVNVGAIVGLLPLTGLPLPFVSHGGSALAVGLAAAGIVMNLSRKIEVRG
ncbi:MAG: putative peptidoglycan glycosyltransferase FtsW [Candidatus Uhrbacteria bacterium]